MSGKNIGATNVASAVVVDTDILIDVARGNGDAIECLLFATGILIRLFGLPRLCVISFA